MCIISPGFRCDRSGQCSGEGAVVCECLNSRFRMFRPSSSSTFGLWLSLLRRNTKTTFWTIVTSAIYVPSSSNRLQLLDCSRSRKKSSMFPSRIQTATVMLGQRRSPHLELSSERESPVWAISTKSLVVYRMLHLQLPCSFTAPPQLRDSSLLSALFELSRDVLLGRDFPSLHGNCMHK